MNDRIIKAAMQAGATRAYPEAQSTRDDAYIVGQQFLERFYAIAYRQGMERAAEIARCEWVTAEQCKYGFALYDAIRAEAHVEKVREIEHDRSCYAPCKPDTLHATSAPRWTDAQTDSGFCARLDG